MGKSPKQPGAEPSATPYHRQRCEKACGIACLRMVEEFLGGPTRSENAWSKHLGAAWTAPHGIDAPQMARALTRLAKERGAELEALCPWAKTEAEWRTGRPQPLVELPTRWAKGEMLLVALVDSFTPRAPNLGNVGHYLVVHDLVRGSRPSRTGGRSRDVAVYHDPLEGPDLYWAWDSLLLATHFAMLVTKPAVVTK